MACGDTDSVAFVEQSPQVMSFEQFLTHVYQEPSDAEGPGVFIANGDEPFQDMAALRDFYDRSIAVRGAEFGRAEGSLIVDLTNGRDNKWSNTQKMNLTYCVSTKFGSNYSKVVSAMTSATQEWEKYANIDFVHVSNQDSNCTKNNNSVVFDVNPVNAGGRYLARAFFPDYPRRNRNILIDGSSFRTSPPLTLTGILRHEVGHTLGFRHEHTRPEAGTCFEDNEWRALTTYDSGSVMHYPQCNGSGDWSLTLTSKDQSGAGVLYP